MARTPARYAPLLVVAIIAACANDSTPSRQPVAPDAPATIDAARADRGDAGDRAPSGTRHIAIRDDCDPHDPRWVPTGGCFLRGGSVTLDEFNGELSSPHSLSVIGHQAWRNDPSYLETESGRGIRITNEGGRVHTFTKVGAFGGGRVPSPALNMGLTMAPECPTSVEIAAGGRMELAVLSPGNHRFQCCIHPWMRALIKVHDRVPGGRH